MTRAPDTGRRGPSPDLPDADGGGLLGAVLAGGGSRRFGRDKTAEPVAGVPMIERAVEALAGVCPEVVVVSSRTETPRGPWRIVPDHRPHRGPLAGIETALTEAGGRAVLVLAADLPLVDAEAVRGLVEGYRGAASGVEAVAAVREGDPGFEPLFAVYGPRCLPAVSRLLDEGRAAAREVFEAVEGRTVSLGDAASLNVNTEEELASAEARLARGETS